MTSQAPTIVLTRPTGASERFAKQLRASALDLSIQISPALEINPVGFTVPQDVSGGVFTSAFGVAAVDGQPLPAWCVGDKTAQKAGEKGWQAISAEGDFETLFKRIVKDAPTGPLIHFRGLHSKGELAARLTAEGIKTTELVVYRQDEASLISDVKHLLMGNQPVILPLFSPRSAATIVAQGPFCAPVTVVAISSAVADIARPIASKGLLISRAPNAKAMVAAINHVVNAACFVEDDANTA